MNHEIETNERIKLNSIRIGTVAATSKDGTRKTVRLIAKEVNTNTGGLTTEVQLDTFLVGPNVRERWPALQYFTYATGSGLVARRTDRQIFELDGDVGL